MRLRRRCRLIVHGRRLAGRSKAAGTPGGTLKVGFRILATFAQVAYERKDGRP
jgi:hypothetical protein